MPSLDPLLLYVAGLVGLLAFFYEKGLVRIAW